MLRRAVGRASPSGALRTFSVLVLPSPVSEHESLATPWPPNAPTSSATRTCHTPTATFRISPPAWPLWVLTSALIGQVWHLPGPETVTTRALLDVVAGEVGHPVDVRSVPKLVLRALGVVNPLMRGLAEMSYEFEEPFVLDTSKYESTFGAAGTSLDVAIKETVVWYRDKASAI